MTYVTKADGSRVPLDLSKVERTCLRAGASQSLSKKISGYISEVAYDGISTRQIYKLVLAALAGEVEHPEVKHRYRLKESIMMLGPAGFNFESYMARVLAENGYQVAGIRSVVKGRCVEHEIDISLISSDGRHVMAECKYHNSPGTFTGLKDSMYTHARFLDIRERNAGLYDTQMIISNTRMSGEAVRFAECVGQDVLSWHFPPERGLERLIERSGLYPVTMLKLTPAEFAALAGRGIVAAKDLLEQSASGLERATGIGAGRLARLQDLTRRILQ